MSESVKIKMRVKSGPLKRGATVEVDAEKADYLIENGHATRVERKSPAPKPKG